MNERIRELAERAFQPINDMSTEGVADRYTFEQGWFQEYNKSFAELIVRQCSSILREEADSNWDGREERLLNAMANWIEEYFGVKE